VPENGVGLSIQIRLLNRIPDVGNHGTPIPASDQKTGERRWNGEAMKQFKGYPVMPEIDRGL
jgi:hypothetical protein